MYIWAFANVLIIIYIYYIFYYIYILYLMVSNVYSNSKILEGKSKPYRNIVSSNHQLKDAFLYVLYLLEYLCIWRRLISSISLTNLFLQP